MLVSTEPGRPRTDTLKDVNPMTVAHTAVITYDRQDYARAACSCGWSTSAGNSGDTARRLHDSIVFHKQHTAR